MHYERFAEEVLPRLSSGESFIYQRFDCTEMRLGETRQVRQSPWRIVEVSYSHHPALDEYMNIRVFCDVTADEQLRRIHARNGEEMAAVFQGRWIPMEAQYFETFQVREKADVLLS